MDGVTVIEHPLVQHKISMLRDKRTGTNEFRTLIEEIATLMGYEALRDLPLDSLSGIERFTRLDWLCLTGTGVTDLTPLKALDRLTEVCVDESMRDAAEALGDIPFTVIYE